MDFLMALNSVTTVVCSLGNGSVAEQHSDAVHKFFILEHAAGCCKSKHACRITVLKGLAIALSFQFLPNTTHS